MLLAATANQVTVSADRGFVTRWTVAGDATARTITLPLTTGNSETYNATIDWGDGSPTSTVTTYDDADRVHAYASDGTYDVTITGTCQGWSFNNTGDRLKCVGVVDWGDASLFGGFRYLANGFYGCANLTSLGSGKVRPYTAGFALSMLQAFRACNIDGALPAGLMDLLTGTTSFRSCFLGNANITSVPDDFFRNNTAVTDFYQTFYGCNKLSPSTGIFYRSGEQSTRFLNKSMLFGNTFQRTAFTGAQGTAPDLWNCDFGETITLDVAPTTDWAPGDTITGQTSGCTSVVVSRTSSTSYKIYKHFGIYTAGEVIGVTGSADKLADQGASYPTVSGKPSSGTCFNGNTTSSLTNHGSIPATWITS